MALQLEVVPLINSEKEVSLDILQKVDSAGWFHRGRWQCDPEYCDTLYPHDRVRRRMAPRLFWVD